jgi:hypothetical protein
MKSTLLSLGLLSFSALASLAPSIPASATCVDPDASRQVASQDRSKALSKKTTQAESKIEDGCLESTTVGKTQIADQVIQTQENEVHMNSSTVNNRQRTTLNLNSADLSSPYILSISTTGSQLNGEITMDGKVIKQLKNNQTSINLSPYLSKGQQTIEISGNYSPQSASVELEFSGPGRNATQQTSGSGMLNYTLMITVD